MTLPFESVITGLQRVFDAGPEYGMDAMHVAEWIKATKAAQAELTELRAVVARLREPSSDKRRTRAVGQAHPRPLRREGGRVDGVQFWLAEMDRHGNPKLCDGAHSARDGVEKAATITRQLGLAHDRRFAVAEVRLSELTGEHAPPVDQEAIKTLNAIGLRPASPTPDKD